MKTKPLLDREKLYSIPDLQLRGWTKTAITSFLPAPDDTRPNPFYNEGGQMKFWLKSRVHRMEKTKRFLAWKVGSADRSYAAMCAAETRTERMVEAIEQAEITIERGWSDEAIRQLAIRTHGGNYAGDPGVFVWSNRTARNTIRHCLTNYESLWRKINRGKTGRPGYERLRARVDALIDVEYPQYREDPPPIS